MATRTWSPEYLHTLAQVAGATELTWPADSVLNQWLGLIAEAAWEAVDEAAENDMLHDTSQTMHQPYQLVPDPDAYRPEDTWQMVTWLHAWKAVDWDAVLDAGLRRVGEPGRPWVERVEHRLLAPENPADMPAAMLRHLGERIAALAVADAVEHHHASQRPKDSE